MSRPQTLTSVVLLLFLALATPAFATTIDSASTQANSLAAMERSVNAARTARGLPPIRLSATLVRSARLRARAIVRCRQFSHTPCGQSFSAPFRTVGYTRGRFSVGENLAWSTGAGVSADHAVAQWLASPPHRRMLFVRTWRELGVSVVAKDGLFAPGPNVLWVAQFGRRR